MTDPTQETGPRSSGNPKRPPRLRLPFDGRKADIGEWAYDHRVGLCVTLIAYLVVAIVFVGGKIAVGGKPTNQTIAIDLRTLAELEAQKQLLEQQVREKQAADWGSVQNAYSDENALREREAGERATHSALDEAGEAAGDNMRANREAWERGLAEEQAIRDRANNSHSGQTTQTTRARGRVTVSYSLEGRTHRHLEVPAYRCQGGGEVVVDITVAPSGEVLAARVASGGDDCMRETALGAARRSLFNISSSAPARQNGTITYLFIPQ